MYYSSIIKGQDNIIPNGDFEYNKGVITCSIYAGCSDPNQENLFNSLIYNWETALHNNDNFWGTKKSVGNVFYFDIGTLKCQELLLSDNTFCSNFIPTFNSSYYYDFTGTKFVRIRADVHKCGNNIKKKHGAIGVALENGQKFQQNKEYIIRYKIVPLRSRNCYGGDICTANQYITHIRFFLSELGPKNWDKNNSDKQELLNVNYAQNLSNSVFNCYNALNVAYKCHPCQFRQEERSFTPNNNVYTTLVVYAENGGALIDDIEVFEKCVSPYHIQKKLYNAMEVIYSGSVIKESSGGSIYAGYNVTSSKPQGNVQVYYNTKVVYTAEDMIALYDGFEVLEGGEFSAEIMPCPNSFNERISNNTQDIQDSTFFDNSVLDRFYDKNIKFIPNPSSDNVKIEMDEDDFYDLIKIELVSPLGQVSELP